MKTVSIQEQTKVKLPLLWLISILGFCCSAGAGIFRLVELGEDAKVTTADVKAIDKRLTVVEEQGKLIFRSLERIERKLDRGQRP